MTEEKSPLPSDTSMKPRRPLWKRMLKWGIWSVVSILSLLLLTLTAIVFILTPERLTPLVERYATDYIDGELNVSRVELTFWSSFPNLKVEVDSLEITSHSLRSIPDSVRAKLPSDADSLLRIRHFNGNINIPRLLIGEIALYDIDIDRPEINLVSATADISNFNIIPTETETGEDKDSTTVIPPISISRFTINDGAAMRYFSLPDTTDITISLNTANLIADENVPKYTLNIGGMSDARLLGLTIRQLAFGIGGSISWNPDKPTEIGLERFKAGIGKLITETSATLNFKDNGLTAESLKLKLEKVNISDIISIIPPELQGELSRLDTDATIEADAELTRPFTPGATRGDTIPSIKFGMTIDGSSLKYEGLDLSRLKISLAGDIDGHNLDESTLNLKKFKATGRSIDIELDGNADNIISDPHVKGNFKGELNIANLPRTLLSRLPMHVNGRLTADAGFNLHLSDLTPKTFHRLLLSGEANLHDFKMEMRDGSANAYLRHGVFNLGTNNSFVTDSHRADSLLTASLKIDTVAFTTPEMKITGSRLLAGVGCSNRTSSSDTTAINPIGGTIKAGRITYINDIDTLRMGLRDLVCRASLTRYNGGKRAPLLTLDIDSRNIRVADGFNFASLHNGNVSLRMHPRQITLPPRLKAKVDSLRALYPRIANDSLHRLAFKELRGNRRRPDVTPDSTTRELIDMSVDGPTRRLLMRWDVRGHVKAKTARLLTPYFPLRNRMTDLDLSFNTDSVTLRDTKLQMGGSDFTVNGSITNIRRAVTSRRGSPIKITFDMQSDKIDVNELANAAFAGQAFAEKIARGEARVIDSENDEIVQASINAGASQEAGALLVPSNVDAEFTVHADRVLYSDIDFHDFNGDVLVYDGAINLHQLKADTDIGSVDLTGLYSAPSADDMNFALDMRLKDFYVERFLRMMPQLDSIMPLLNDVKGIINADIAATSAIDRNMNLVIPSLSAAIKLTGDSLVLLDAETFRTVGKWLLFKDKRHNMIDHMEVSLIVEDSYLELFPFMFDIDRYKLGVMGGNDLAMNYKYHVSVLKSPIPFKFGINLSGNADKMKVRLGGAKFKENMVGERIAIVDTTRINLVRDINTAFRRGVKRGGLGKLDLKSAQQELSADFNGKEESDTISHSDSLLFIKEGLLPAPPPPPVTTTPQTDKGKKKKK